MLMMKLIDSIINFQRVGAARSTVINRLHRAASVSALDRQPNNRKLFSTGMWRRVPPSSHVCEWIRIALCALVPPRQRRLIGRLACCVSGSINQKLSYCVTDNETMTCKHARTLFSINSWTCEYLSKIRDGINSHLEIRKIMSRASSPNLWRDNF